MVERICLLFALITLNSNLIAADIDGKEFRDTTQIFHDGDDGIILEKSNESIIFDEYNNDFVVEKIFENKTSRRKIYYTGAEYRGNGVFWIENNGTRNVVLNTHIRYGAKIIWHGNDIAEIPVPTGSPFTHSYYYDFLDGLLSASYSFPIYYDVDNNVVLIWGNEDFELYNTKTNELLKTYNHRRNMNWTTFWPYIKYYIEKDGLYIFLYYEDWLRNSTGKIIIEINMNKTNGT
jgi:hypothetical protein